MKWLVVLVLLVHGLIHALGFVKAFGLADIEQLRQPISRPWGMLWGACALVLVAAAAARIAGGPWWWTLAAPGVVASQVVIVAFWTDARFGTFANVVLLVPVVLGFGSSRFAARVEAEVGRLAERAGAGEVAVVEARELEALPPPVQTWLGRAGVVGRPRARTVHLTQRGELQTAPDGEWTPFTAEQYVLAHDPTFVWIAEVDGRFGLRMAGLDHYLDGRGAMRIELLSLVPVVDRSGPTIDQGALVRFLAEAMWYPSAALEPYLRWEAVDDRRARATIRRGGVVASGVFRFDEGGDVVGFEARRYRDDTLEDWLIDNDPEAFGELDGVRVPTRSAITWRDAAGQRWTWLRLEITSLERGIELAR
jgi:hypothetical protein